MEREQQLQRKQQIRKEMLQQRGQLSPAEVNSCSRRIISKLMQLKAVSNARVIMGFMSIRNEVELWPWLQQLQQQDKTVLLPRVIDHQDIQAIPFRHEEALQKSHYGILEPVGLPYAPAHIDVVLVPGLAFDYKGYRIGYGKGYYDRFLPRLGKQTFICGVCYEFQVVASAYPQPTDYAVDWIVSECSELMIAERFF